MRIAEYQASLYVQQMERKIDVKWLADSWHSAPIGLYLEQLRSYDKKSLRQFIQEARKYRNDPHDKAYGDCEYLTISQAMAAAGKEEFRRRSLFRYVLNPMRWLRFRFFATVLRLSVRDLNYIGPVYFPTSPLRRLGAVIGSPFLVGTHFYRREWKWVWGTAIGLAGVVVAYLAIR